MPKHEKKRPEPTKLYQPKTKTDPQGSYTGVGVNAKEKPVQDADDL